MHHPYGVENYAYAYKDFFNEDRAEAAAHFNYPLPLVRYSAGYSGPYYGHNYLVTDPRGISSRKQSGFGNHEDAEDFIPKNLNKLTAMALKPAT